MGQPEGIHAHLVEEAVIRQMILLLQGRCQPIPILMPGHTVEFEMLSVQEETLFAVHMEVAEADVLFHPVDFLAVLDERHHGLVQVRIGLTVPKVRVADGDVAGDDVIDDMVIIRLGNFISCRIRHGKTDLAPLIIRQRGKVDLRSQLRPLAGGLLGDQHAVRTIIQRRNAGRFQHFQPDIAVQAAVNVEVARERSHLERLRIVADDRYLVLARLYIIRNLENERIVCALVLPDEGAVHHQGSHTSGPFELEEQPFAGIAFRNFQRPVIGAVAPVIGAFRLEIIGIPGVRQRHGLPYRAPAERCSGHGSCLHETFEKGPAIIQRLHFPRLERVSGQQQQQPSHFTHITSSLNDQLSQRNEITG